MKEEEWKVDTTSDPQASFWQAFAWSADMRDDLFIYIFKLPHF